MDGYIERQTLQDIADAIRAKNGSSDTYTPSEMAEAIKNIESGGGEGFDLIKHGFDREYHDKFNSYIKNALFASDEINNNLSKLSSWANQKAPQFLSANMGNATSLLKFGSSAIDNSLIYVINKIDTSNATSVQELFYNRIILVLPSVIYLDCKKVSGTNRIASLFQNATFYTAIDEITIDVGDFADIQKALTGNEVFYTSTNINSCKKFNIIGDRLTSVGAWGRGFNINELYFPDASRVSSFTNSFTATKDKKIGNWKQTNLSLNASQPPESTHYIIQNAISLADGATARTLTLHATAKANWEASEYYNEDMAVLEEKGITIA